MFSGDTFSDHWRRVAIFTEAGYLHLGQTGCPLGFPSCTNSKLCFSKPITGDLPRAGDKGAHLAEEGIVMLTRIPTKALCDGFAGRKRLPFVPALA